MLKVKISKGIYKYYFQHLGYTGTLCETIASVIGTTVAANGCTINPCQNGGTCVTQPNGAFLGCFCTTGFIGTNCQIAS